MCSAANKSIIQKMNAARHLQVLMTYPNEKIAQQVEFAFLPNYMQLNPNLPYPDLRLDERCAIWTAAPGNDPRQPDTSRYIYILQSYIHTYIHPWRHGPELHSLFYNISNSIVLFGFQRDK